MPLPQAGPDYTLFHLADDPQAPLGGMGGPGPDAAAGDESRWVPYFVVDDVDTALAAGTAHGGAVAQSVRDTPWGRMAALADPFGAEFSVITPVGPTPQR